MKFGILVNEGPYQHQASDSAFLFAKAALEDRLYFSKLKKMFNLNSDLDVLEIGFGNGSFLDFAR